MDAIQKAKRALETGAKTFRWYQELHAAKPDPEKAARNAEFAVIMEEALTALREYRDENARLRKNEQYLKAALETTLYALKQVAPVQYRETIETIEQVLKGKEE